MTSPDLSIAGRPIGAAHPPYVIAELSANHNGDKDRATAILRAAADAGADAVKLQTYTPDTMTIDHDGPDFVIDGGLWDGRKLYDLYAEATTPWEWHAELFALGRELGVAVFSSPFDASAVEFLEDLDAPAYKIASFEIVDLPLIERCAATGKPLVMSTGMATLGEIEAALAAARGAGAHEILLLHCVSGYPTPPEDCALGTIAHMAETFDTLVGLSDHTLGNAVAIAAVALGAVAIEKHLTLSRADGGPDSAFSLEPDEFASLVQDARTAFAARSPASYRLKPSETANRRLRRSLYVVADVEPGEFFSASNLRNIRPGHGSAPEWIGRVLGQPATRAIRRGEPFDPSMIATAADDG